MRRTGLVCALTRKAISADMPFLKDVSLSAVVAGFVTVLVGFTSSGVIVFQAAHALGAAPHEIASWMWALGLGMGFTCIALSLRYRMPIVTAGLRRARRCSSRRLQVFRWRK